ncbi:MAG TPA: FAD-dependent oxidoreductase [Candidatus Fermentibacter daniensis]|nr:MAG: Hydrogen cyanide synthase subunit HcnB [candidate division Hyd24-12 bacterium ADurb.Bin004]HPH40738.1 FAD-dependent oxidoreductase [Candidatus Fermentibacter daniensis]
MFTGSVQKRITSHPVLPCPEPEYVRFRFDGEDLMGRKGEMVSSALFANGVRVFGHHAADGGAQGIFCANGQCSQCNLLIDGVVQKSCVTALAEGMEVRSVNGLPVLADIPGPCVPSPVSVDTDVLIIGAGPAGLAAALELGRAGARTILVDDKDRPGGKLVLQTHKFFGSEEDCYAGTRGIEIASILAGQLASQPSVDVWTSSTVLAVFSDGLVGVRRPGEYVLVRPRHLLVASGAREKSLVFPGNTLPGVYGAGAFQTLVNRDLVRSSERVFIVGGGNVGLIAAYHALQAGIAVVGLVEAMPVCGGYKVHADKIRRLGVPILTGHTILAAHGSESLEAVTVAAVDKSFRPIPGTERSYSVDTLLVAVGLDPVNEFHRKAVEFGIPVSTAGDAEEIAEASAAMFSGRIRGMEIACSLGLCLESPPADWIEKSEVLKSPGGAVHPYSVPDRREGVFPVLHCMQEIPCNPCMTSCPKNLIGTSGHPILGIPEYSEGCIGCEKCVSICPGLAITLVDFRKDPRNPVVTVPFELDASALKAGTPMDLTDWEGASLGRGILLQTREVPGGRRTVLLRIQTSPDIAARIAGVGIQDESVTAPEPAPATLPLPDDAIVCRCERVTAGAIRKHLRDGVRDLNELKALTRAGFGACGGKTCRTLLARIAREEGIAPSEIEPLTERPLFAETPLGFFSGRCGE